MSPCQFSLEYAESRLVWLGFKPPLPAHDARFSLSRVFVFTLGQTLVGAMLGWFIAVLLGMATRGTGPFVLFDGPFSWLIWLLAALSACQGILSYGFTALCWNQRAARLLADPSHTVALNPARYPVFRWLTGLFYFALFALVAPIAMLWTIENVRGELLWRLEKNKLIAQGERLSFQELAGPLVAPEQNAGAAPLFAPFFDYRLRRVSENRVEAEWLNTKGLERVEERLKFPARAYPREQDLLSGTNSIAAVLSLWSDAYRKLVGTPANSNPAWVQTLKLPADTNDTARTVLAGLSVANEQLAELCEASARPRSQFPLHYDEGFNALLRHLTLFKSANQKLALRCAARLETGDTNGAFADAQCALHVAELLREEPLLISQLVRYAQGAIAVRTVWTGLTEHRWSDEQLAQLQSELAKINYLPGMELAFEGERACGIQTFNDWVSRAGSPADMIGPDENNQPMRLPARIFSRGMLRQNELTMVRYQQQMIASMRRAISNAPATGLVSATREVSNVVDRAQHDLKPFSPYRIMAAMLAPAVGRAVEKSVKYQTVIEMAETACALERYRLKHGVFPEKLEDLAPTFLTATPLDPMNGQPFHYRRTDDGWFLLYSVGLNGQDDAGQFIVTKDKKSEELDWPWPVPTRLVKRNLF